MRRVSIRKKLVSMLSIFITAVMLCFAWGTYVYFGKSTQRLILEHQSALVDSMAQKVDDQLTTALSSLNSVAKISPYATTDDREVLQRWLNDRVGIKTIFNHAIIILDAQGTLVVTNPPMPELYGKSFANREYFRQSMNRKSPYISDPFVTAANDQPVVMMTAPIFDASGQLRGFLGGSIDLHVKGGVFEIIRQTRIGTTGYLYLFAKDRTLIMHPEEGRIMTNDVPTGVNRLFDQAVAGLEGAGETVNSRGVSMLATFKHIPSTGWILAGNYPVQEAYQPIKTFGNYYFFGMLLMLLLSITLARRFGSRLAEPLEQFIIQLQSLAGQEAAARRVKEDSEIMELAELGKAFNGLLAEIEQHEAGLAAANIQLSQAVVEAQAANVAKRNFLANMSHEIRTPMNGIMGFMELLENSSLSEKQRDLVREVKGASELLLHVINDILDFSKIEAGKLTVENIRFRLPSLVEDAAGLIRPKAEEKNIALHVTLKAGVPEEVWGDPTRLRQVLNNLLGNAVKFTQSGEVAVEVDSQDEGEDLALVTFTVQDTGIGISEDNLPKLFQVFNQADTSTTRQYGGTGLGLAICKELVELMGGMIEVESQLGEGSVFRFYLWLKKVRQQTVSSQEVERLRGVKVLIADSEDASRQCLAAYLQEAGCQTVMAGDAGQALIELVSHNTAEEKISAVLLEYQLPGMNAYEIAATLQTIPYVKDIPLILLNGAGKRGDGSSARQHGFCASLHKSAEREYVIQGLAAAIHHVGDRAGSLASYSQQEAETGRKLKILLAEDNDMNRSVVEKMLHSRGYSCDVAGDGAETVQAASRQTYDVILMDCQMPVMDGYQATEAIRRQEKEQRSVIIAMTAHAMDSDKARCLASGMDYYLSKPVDFAALFALLEECQQQEER